MDYLRGRGILDEYANRFNLGAWPADINDLLRYIKPTYLFENKYAWNEDGYIHTKFDKNNFIIPIYDAYGNPIAIQGRCIGDHEELGVPKYINTRYNKRDHLYGLNIAKPYIRNKNKVLIVEGIIDVVKAHQNGINNCVAVLGTALTKEHMVLLARYTDKIYLCFDNDEAGDKATERAIELSKSFRDLKVYSKRPPKGFKDLDEYFSSK